MAKCMTVGCNGDDPRPYYCQDCWNTYAANEPRMAMMRLYSNGRYFVNPDHDPLHDPLHVNSAIDLELEMKENVWLDVPY